MNPQGFDEFYTKTFARVLSVVIMASGSRLEAEDAVQDGYLSALRHWEQVGGYEQPDAWVIKVALRRLWRSRRAHQRKRQPLELTVPPQAAPDETAHAREVLSALAGLPADVRIAMITCSVLGWTQAELAEVLDVPRNTIANRIFRGRAMLRVQLGLAGTLVGEQDALVAAPRRAEWSVVPDDDPVDGLLLQAERWLRAAVEAEPETAEWIMEQVTRQAAAPPSRWRHPGRTVSRWLGASGRAQPGAAR